MILRKKNAHVCLSDNGWGDKAFLLHVIKVKSVLIILLKLKLKQSMKTLKLHFRFSKFLIETK